jgi:hypothetical protein
MVKTLVVLIFHVGIVIKARPMPEYPGSKNQGDRAEKGTILTLIGSF